MALLFVDSFDHYSNPAEKYTNAQGEPRPFIEGGGRSGTNRITMHNDWGRWGTTYYGESWVQKTLASNVTKLIVGFALYITRQQSRSPVVHLPGVNVHVGTDFKPFTSSGYTVPVVLQGNQWFYLEIKVDYTAKTVHFQVDGLPVGNTTIPGLGASGGYVYLGSAVHDMPGNDTATFWYSYDDFYICDGTGSVNNDFLGDVQVLVVRPQANGSTNQFSPIGAAQNWDAVNDTTPDSDTTYNLGIAKNQIDAYNMQNVTNLQGTVNGVQAVMYARKEGAGTRLLTPYVRTGVAEGTGPEKVALGTSYRLGTSVMNINPATGNPWQVTDVNGSDFGVKIDT